jgi:signal transduction histidine kinase
MVQALVVVILALVEPRLPARVQGLRGHAGLFPLATLCAVVWSAIRLCPHPGPWPRSVLREGAIAIAQGLVIAVPIAGCSWLATAAPGTAPARLAALLVSPAGVTLPTADYRLPAQYFAALVALAMGLYLLLRLGIPLWLLWNQLRHRRLRWALTHAHLTLVALGAALVSVAVLAANLRTPDVLADAAILVTGTVLVLLVVLPPSALFSHVVTRGTVRRIEALAMAADRFRWGDRAARVPVEGADEVARLQADFNAMAADLDRALRDVQAERDTVTRLLQARRDLVAGVSHELRTPVAILRGYLESARAHWQDEPPPNLREDLAVMEREVIRLQGLIDDLFTLARSDAGRLELRCAPVDVGALACRCVETVAPLAWQAARVEVLAEITAGVPAVWGDPARLEQALHNLLHNAVRHTPPGGIVAVSVAAEPGAVLLRVRDTGEGIMPSELPRIWERFYRAEGTRMSGLAGTGLGLTLVKDLIEAMAGTIAAESMPGQGTSLHHPPSPVPRVAVTSPVRALRGDTSDVFTLPWSLLTWL